MIGTLDEWRQVVELPELVEAAAQVAPGDVTGVARLRRRWEPALLAVALELAAARRKSASKWPGREIVADPAGVEMATSGVVGAHKARRLARAGSRVLDLCCGIGGDAMAMADAGLEVEGIDACPVRAWMCGRNAGWQTRVADVGEVVVDRPYHLDPARRRAGGGRLWRYEDLEPGPQVIDRIARGDGAVKLGPGVELEALPPGEVEMISERGTLVQAVLWTGRLAEAARRATALPSGATIAGEPEQAPVADAGAWLFAVDPGVERAGLMGNLARELGMGALHPRLGLLTGDQPAASGLVTAYRLEARMPWRVRRVREWLRARDGGVVEVKTRGRAVDPDRVQAELRGDGSLTYTVFVLRFDRRVEALIARREG